MAEISTKFNLTSYINIYGIIYGWLFHRNLIDLIGPTCTMYLTQKCHIVWTHQNATNHHIYGFECVAAPPK